MNKQCLAYGALVLALITDPLPAQSLPHQVNVLQWANIGLNGVPTGTFIPLNNLSTDADFIARYGVQIAIPASTQLSPGDSFTGTFPDPDPNHLPPLHPVVHWPGTSSGSLAGDYRLESTFEGFITRINNNINPFPINPNFAVTPNLNSSFDATITGGNIELFNARTNELIANLPVQGGEALGIHAVVNDQPTPYGSLTLNAALGPGCVNCDPYILMPDGSSVNGRNILATFTGQAPVLSSGYDPTAGQLELLIQNNGTSSAFQVPNVAPIPDQRPISWVAIVTADNIMEGNNGNPMQTLLSPGQSSAGAVGSVGRIDHQRFDANLGNGQARFSHNFGFAQVNLSGGGLWTNNNDTFRGDATLQGAYAVPEVIFKIPKSSIHVTATGLYSPGKINPDVSTLGGRLRADWLDAVKVRNAAFTPYASYAYIHSSIASFQDSIHPLPVSWDHHADQVNTARYGIDAVIGVTPKINLLARIEGSHRFESHTNNTTGRITGVVPPIDLNLPGIAYKQDWVRGAVGLESKIGKRHFFGILLNATSQGPVTSYWLTTNYRAAF